MLSVLLSGCLQTQEELTIAADGSGKVQLEVRTAMPAELLESVGIQDGSQPIFPPLSARDAAKFFPDSLFADRSVKEETQQGARVIKVEATFKSINNLLASPYAVAHALSVEITNGVLKITALTGLEAAARLAEMKSQDGLFGAQVAGFEGLQKQAAEMRGEFRIRLPQTIQSGDGDGKTDGQTITWVAGRSQFTNSNQFARKLGNVLVASCSAGDFPIPSKHQRLALHPFEVLVDGTSTGSSGGADPDKVRSSARFVPQTLQVTRSLDLSGDGGSHENQAVLTGALILPKDRAPAKWGEASIDEVIDASGRNLKRDESSSGRRYFSQRFESIDQGETGAGPAPPSGDIHRTITLQFHPPEWAVTEITRIKASVPLHYSGGSVRLFKLTNAIPASWIQDASKAMDAAMALGSTERAISQPGLKAIGTTAKLKMGIAQAAFTILMVELSGKTTGIAEAQAYDSTGHAWPTILQQQQSGEAGTYQVVIAGRPVAPLSLALKLNSDGGGISVPITLENVPITSN
jgi:hypothetical protein